MKYFKNSSGEFISLEQSVITMMAVPSSNADVGRRVFGWINSKFFRIFSVFSCFPNFISKSLLMSQNGIWKDIVSIKRIPGECLIGFTQI